MPPFPQGARNPAIMNTEKYIGIWLLLPELSIYQLGEPPVSGRYSINSIGDNIKIAIEWKDISGTDHSLSFGGPLDGIKHESEASGFTDVMYEKIDDATLDTTAFNGENVLLYARRVASNAGDLLAVSQVTFTDNCEFSNFQVYRREGS